MQIRNKDVKKNSINVFALGGLAEIGKNCYVIEYNDMIFIIDCGVLFSEDNLLGIDYVIPPFDYLRENEERIVGLFITHGHEDHIGGIPYLLKDVKIPTIYAPKMAADLIADKLDNKFNGTKMVIVDEKSKFNFKDVEISFLRVSHSIPDSFGCRVNTPLGSIFHTGDFKIDMTPVGPHADYAGWTKMAEEKTLLLMADSTNAERKTQVLSETTIGNSIRKIISDIEGRIIIATFASNVFRVQQIIEASVEAGRKVCVLGRSMQKVTEIARKNKYINIPDEWFVDINRINSVKHDELTIICTGSQGENLAVLSRIADGSHRQIKAVPGDTVIFSSSAIPGNQQAINVVVNRLSKLGVTVITNGNLYDTHTSGHADQEGLKLMLNLTKPKYFMPIHGEHRMQVIHTDLAVEVGVDPDDTFVMDNGDVLTINEEGAFVKKGVIKADPVFVEGSGVVDPSADLVAERKKLSEAGVFVIVLTIDKKYQLLSDVSIVSRGFIYVKQNEELLQQISKMVQTYIDTVNITTDEQLVKDVTNLVEELVVDDTGRKPYILVSPIFIE